MNVGSLSIGAVLVTGLGWLKLKGWTDGGAAVVVDSGRESLPHDEGRQLYEEKLIR